MEFKLQFYYSGCFIGEFMKCQLRILISISFKLCIFPLPEVPPELMGKIGL